MSYQQTMDNLKLKLTLKKQTWTGGSSSTDNEMDKANQPLAWGISVINRRKTIKPDPNEELLAYDHDHPNQNRIAILKNKLLLFSCLQ